MGRKRDRHRTPVVGSRNHTLIEQAIARGEYLEDIATALSVNLSAVEGVADRMDARKVNV